MIRVHKKYSKIIPDSAKYKSLTFFFDISSTLEFFSSVIILFLFVSFCGCISVKDKRLKNSSIISVKDFGAQGDGQTDDSDAFHAALTYAANGENRVSEIKIPRGRYLINGKTYEGALSENLRISGESGTIILCKKPIFKLTGKKQQLTNIKLPLRRGEASIIVNNLLQVKSGIIKIYSDVPAEKSWNTVKIDVQDFISLGNKLKLGNTLNFNYERNEKLDIEIFQKRKLIIENIKFITEPSLNFGFVVEGLELSFTNLEFSGDGIGKSGSHAIISACTNSTFNNLSFRGKAYGFNIVQCRNIKAFNTFAENIAHPYSVGRWTDTFYASGIRGKNTTIDAHPSFNVHYNDVRLHTGKSYFNCRALGVKITNSGFTCDEDYLGKATGIQSLFLTKENDDIYNEYDVIIDNVEWTHKSTKFNGFNAFRGKNFIVKNSTTHAVSVGEFSKVKIINSKIGMLKSKLGDIEVVDTEFDGSLQELKNPEYAMAFGYSGKTTVSRCSFKNYNSEKSYLLDYLQGPKTSYVYFEDCEITGFAGIVRKFAYPNLKYIGLSFINCRLENITEPLPVQLEKAVLKNSMKTDFSKMKRLK